MNFSNKEQDTKYTPLPVTEEDAHKKKTRRMVVVIAVFALCTEALVVRSLTLLAPFIRLELHLDERQFGLMVGALMAGTLLAILPVGRLVDRLDARWAFPILLTSVGLALLLVSMQHSFTGLIAALFVLGLVRSGIVPLVNRVVTTTFDRDERGVFMGGIYAAVPLGGFLGAVILPGLGEYFDWNSGYRVLGLLALFGSFLSLRRIPKDKSMRQAGGPILDFALLRTKTFLILAGIYGLYVFGLTVDVFVTLFLVDVVKTSASTAGVYFGLIQLTGVGGRFFWGILADRGFQKNRWWLLALINWLTVIAFVLLSGLNSGSTWWMIGGVMLLIGMSAASSWGVLSTLLGDVVGVNSIAIATSMIFLITSIAEMAGPILFGAALDVTASYQKTIGIFIGVTVCTAFALSWMAWRGYFKQKTDPVETNG
jgi:MFS family permease